MSVERRRILLMRHGAVEYFDNDGRPFPSDDVPLTARGIEQAQAMGRALETAGVKPDRVITSGLARTRSTASHVLASAGLELPAAEWPALQEIRGGRLASIPDADVRTAFLTAFEGPAPRDARFLNGETIGELLDRALPALANLLEDPSWDTALLVLHGGVNRALLSWFLTGQSIFLGGLAQDPGCINIIDAGPTPAQSIVRVVNYSVLEPFLTDTRLSTMEHLLAQYLRLRGDPAQAVGERT